MLANGYRSQSLPTENHSSERSKLKAFYRPNLKQNQNTISERSWLVVIRRVAIASVRNNISMRCDIFFFCPKLKRSSFMDGNIRLFFFNKKMFFPISFSKNGGLFFVRSNSKFFFVLENIKLKH